MTVRRKRCWRSHSRRASRSSTPLNCRDDLGATMANTLARRLVVAPHRAGGQAQFIASPLPDGHGPGTGGDQYGLPALLDRTRERLHEPVTVAELARRANMSLRHFSRRFIAVTGTSPLQWLLTQRIRRAQELLETTDSSIEQIAEQVGMGTATTLRRNFHRIVGVSPSAYRRTFSESRGADGSEGNPDCAPALS